MVRSVEGPGRWSDGEVGRGGRTRGQMVRSVEGAGPVGGQMVRSVEGGRASGGQMVRSVEGAGPVAVRW